MNTKISASILLFFLAMNLCLWNKAEAQAQGSREIIDTYGDFQYKYVKETDSILIAGYIGNEEVVVVPSEIDGKTVTEIRHMGDCYNYGEINPDTKEIIIPEGVKKIAGFTPCLHVVKVVIPNSLEEIERYTFDNCEELQFIELPNSLKEIGEDAFFRCMSLKEVTLPDNLKTIHSGTFAFCENLEKVTIPYGVKKIEDGAFDGCSSLEKVSIPDSVTVLGEDAFFCCTKLSKVKLSNNIRVIGEECFNGCSIKSIRLPKKLIRIEKCAFSGNPLALITIPSKVTYIGDSAFASCKKLKKVIIKGTRIKKIGKRAFADIYAKAVFDVPNNCVPKYKKMLVDSKNFREGKMKIK